ncbi:MAG TPA: prepilin-type N-terminal cleavage/methylation domain-containing protein [Longimicrobiaceae bacterium]|jgi:prepilin-type N-terminal cleavage/methylation domain-containing protein|nr:prepilin-type N-terminal cleavage/methylation domain-containing protein [Longimicrobiaceae bacterium]
MSRSPDDGGFTLIEAVVALVVVGLVLGGALGAAAADLRATRKAASVAEASALAEDLLFRSQFLRWDSLTQFGEASTGRFAAPMDRYEWNMIIDPSPAEPDLVEATVTVRWSGGEVTASSQFVPPADASTPGEAP